MTDAESRRPPLVDVVNSPRRHLRTLSCASPASAQAAFTQMNDITDERAERERQRELTRTVVADDVSVLADALRAAKQAHSAAMAELRQADVEPVEDWATWYAEYLLGVG